MPRMDKIPHRLSPLRGDGMWKQERYLPNTVNEDGLSDYEPFTIKRENGQWFISQGDGSGVADWVSVREDMAKVIVVGIEAERRMKERKDSWELDSSFPDDWDEEGNEIYTLSGVEYEKKMESLALPKTYMEFYTPREWRLSAVKLRNCCSNMVNRFRENHMDRRSTSSV